MLGRSRRSPFHVTEETKSQNSNPRQVHPHQSDDRLIVLGVFVFPRKVPNTGEVAPPRNPKRDVGRDERMLCCHGLSNWGRWGQADQPGTLKYITPPNPSARELVTGGKKFSWRGR